MIVKNAQDYIQCFGEKQLYFFAIGYEHRSFFLYDKLQKKFPANKPVVFALDDYTKCPDAIARIRTIIDKELPVYVQNYNDSNKVHNIILEIVQKHIEQSDSLTIHIDYSSMPRSWYCKLPLLLEKIMRDTDKVYFWYSEGEYPASHEEYPSSGIEAFSFFSGKPSLQIESNRIHVIALGYDVIRTQAILSITDPNYLIACYAYNPKREGFLENLKQVNDPILSRAAMSLALHIDDFEFMVSKLCDTANELLPVGDVILIPDGPKPLIFALSLIPDLVGKQGLTCLHITRNNDYYEAMDIAPTGAVFGFLVQTDRETVRAQ